MNLKELLPLVERPGRYLGLEVNAKRKDWDRAELRVCLIFPDLYEIGMSHLGLQVLYHILNEIPWVLADRAYCPERDMEELLKKNGLPLWGLETRRALKEFDILAFTLPYELCYSNILTILDLSGIPHFSSEREKCHFPIVIGGGSSSTNPEPVADFFDAIFIGEGEEAIKEIVEKVRDFQKGDRGEFLKALSGIEGMYVPGFYKPIYDNSCRGGPVCPPSYFKGMEIQEEAPQRIRRRIVPDLSKAPFPKRPLVPFTQMVHDRLGVEISRGCTRGCRFCQAGVIYRPVRERRRDEVLRLMDEGIRATGFDEASLLSLSTGDYSLLLPLLCSVMGEYQERHISLALPSIRVGTLSDKVVEIIRKGRKTGFTMAPEAGSERLRKVINKDISEEALLSASKKIFSSGWSGIKLYFMIGLPTETREDVLAIAELAKKVLNTGKSVSRRATVTVSVGTFVPKPHTPFQWERQITPQESRERLEILRIALNGNRRIKLKWHNPELSFLEGIFSRGDRRLAKVIERAWEMGAGLDGWSDHARPDLYIKAFHELGLDPKDYLLERDQDAPFPWDHIHTGVSRKFLRMERDASRKEIYTPDCRSGDCQGCGVCDFKTIFPVIQKNDILGPSKDDILNLSKSCKGDQPVAPTSDAFFPYHIIFTKLFDARFLGHLDLVRSFHRALRRAEIPIAYSEGHHPMPKVSFADPISLGTESACEHAILRLKEEWDEHRIMSSLNKELIHGLSVVSCQLSVVSPRLASPIMGEVGGGSEPVYLIAMPFLQITSLQDTVKRFMDASHLQIKIERKGKEFSMDLKEKIEDISLPQMESHKDNTLVMAWLNEILSLAKDTPILSLKFMPTAEKRPKIREILGSLFHISQEESLLARILKVGATGRSPLP